MVSNMKRNILIISLLILVSVSSVALLILNNAHIDKSNDEEIGAENYCLRYLEKYVKFYTTKKVYYIGEEIVITIINTGDKQIKLSKGGNPEISPLAIYKIIEDSKGVVIHNPKIGEIILKPGEKLLWSWDMKAFGEYVAPGEYAVGIDYNDLHLQIGDKSIGICTSTIGAPIDSFRAPFAKFIIVEECR